MDEHVCKKVEQIQSKLVDWLDDYIHRDLKTINSKELFEVADVVKDMSETLKSVKEALYYEKVIKAMEDKDQPNYLTHSKPYVNQMPYVEDYLYGDRHMSKPYDWDRYDREGYDYDRDNKLKDHTVNATIPNAAKSV